MTESIDVAAAKSHFSDLLNRTAYNRERFIISRRGKPVAALVSADDLARLESVVEPAGLLAVAGLFGDAPDWTAELDRAVEVRRRAVDRPVTLG
jgi:prevent-host-death family protein